MEALSNIWFWVDALAFSLMLFLIIYLVFKNIVWRKRVEDGALEYLKLTLDSQAKIQALLKELEKREDKSIEQTDGFVKFLSESRDWAFEYIENVQQAIGAVKTSASFGKVSEESLIELFSFLPESNKENNNEQGND
jgi:hypothetical protein